MGKNRVAHNEFYKLNQEGNQLAKHTRRTLILLFFKLDGRRKGSYNTQDDDGQLVKVRVSKAVQFIVRVRWMITLIFGSQSESQGTILNLSSTSFCSVLTQHIEHILCYCKVQIWMVIVVLEYFTFKYRRYSKWTCFNELCQKQINKIHHGGTQYTAKFPSILALELVLKWFQALSKKTSKVLKFGRLRIKP